MARGRQNASGNDGFTAEDRETMASLVAYVKKLNSYVSSLKTCLQKANKIITDQNKEMNFLRTSINLANYRTDAREQYNRRESFKVINVTDELGNDPEKIIFDICKEIEDRAPPDNNGEKVSFNLKTQDICRCHFMGTGERKKLICKFTPSAYRLKSKLMLNKRHVNKIRDGKFKKAFIAEDLTPLRSRLLWFIKNKFDHKYHKVHSRNGVIKMKLKSDDTNSGDWISVSNPDDLHKLVGDQFDVAEFNKGLKDFQILTCISLPTYDLSFDNDEPLDFDV